MKVIAGRVADCCGWLPQEILDKLIRLLNETLWSKVHLPWDVQSTYVWWFDPPWLAVEMIVWTSLDGPKPRVYRTSSVNLAELGQMAEPASHFLARKAVWVHELCAKLEKLLAAHSDPSRPRFCTRCGSPVSLADIQACRMCGLPRCPNCLIARNGKCRRICYDCVDEMDDY